MKFYKFTIIFIVFISGLSICAVYASDWNLKKVTVDADQEVLWGEFYWPVGSASFGSSEIAFMTWDKLVEGDVTYHEGFLYFNARNDREQPNLPGVDDSSRLLLNYDAETNRVTGSIQLYAVSTYDFEKFTGYVEGGWVNYGNPQDYGRSFTEAVCEAWLDIPVDFELTYDEYYRKFSFAEEVDGSVTFKAKIKRSGYPTEKVQPKYVEETRVANIRLSLNGYVYNYGQDVYASFRFWNTEYAVGLPTTSFSLESGSPSTAVTNVEWMDDESLRVSGPETVGVEADEVTFDLAGNLEADSYTWTVSYYHPNGYWDELDPVVMDSMGSLVLNEVSDVPLARLKDLLYEHGVKTGDVRQLEMKVSASANAGGEVSQSNEHLFRVSVNEDLQLTVGGPAKISGEQDMLGSVTFTASGSGDGVSSVRWLDWYFYYYDEYGEWQLADRVDVDGGVQDMEVPWNEGEVNWDSWAEMAGYHGADVEDKKVLEMKAVAKAVGYGETEIATSNTHLFTVEYTKQFILVAPKKVTVSPAGPNRTKITLSYGTLELSEPIEFKVVRKPHFIDVEFRPDKVETNIQGVGETVMKVSTNPDSINEPLLPTSGLLVIEAVSGGVEATAEIELQIVPAEWLVLYYSCTDTPQSLQEEDEVSVIDLINWSVNSTRAGVGALVMIELEKDWIHQYISSQPFDVKTLKGGDTYMLEIRDGNVSLIGGAGVGQQNLGHGDILKQFVESSRDRIPSERTLLVVSDHGEGIRGVVFDKSPYDRLTAKEIGDALEWSPVDVLLFDACYMGQIEVLYELHGCADYIVASEVKMPKSGIDYPAIINLLTYKPSTTPKELAVKIVETFRPDPNKDQHLAAIDTSKLPQLVQAVGRLSDSYLELFNQNRSIAYYAIDSTLDYGYLAIENRRPLGKPLYTGHPYYDLVDVSRLMSHFTREAVEGKWVKRELNSKLGEIDGYARQVHGLVNETVVKNRAQTYLQYSKKTSELVPSYSGVSVFFWPGHTFRVQKRVLKDYEGYFLQTRFNEETHWWQLVQNFLVDDAEYILQEEKISKIMKDYNKAVDNFFAALSHPQHELYPHIYTSDGLHVGVEPGHWSRTAVDLEVPGSFYYDFGNGTKIISVPANVTGYTFVVDGSAMEEEQEDYSVRLVYTEDGEQVSTFEFTGEIEVNTAHSAAVDIGGGEMSVGEVVVEVLETEAGSETVDEATGGSGIPGAPLISMLLGLAGFAFMRLRRKPTNSLF